MRTLNLELSWADVKVSPKGSIVLEILGHSDGGVSHLVKVHMGPSSIGYLGFSLHECVREQQKTLDEVKAKLRGPG